MSYLEIDEAKISILGKDLYKTVYKNGALFNAIHLEKIRKAYTTLFGNEDLRGLRLMVVFDGKIEMSHDVGERYITHRMRHKKAEAYVSKDPETLQYLKAVVALLNTEHPVEIFNSETKALDWLKSV